MFEEMPNSMSRLLAVQDKASLIRTLLSYQIVVTNTNAQQRRPSQLEEVQKDHESHPRRVPCHDGYIHSSVHSVSL